MMDFENARKGRKGQAVVEFAILLPIFLLLLCGIIDFGWMLSNKLLVSYCSREGARYGIVVASETDSTSLIAQRVYNIAPSYIRNGLTVSVSYSDPDDHRNGDVSVDVSYSANVLTPVGGVFTKGSSVKLDAVCVMKAE